MHGFNRGTWLIRIEDVDGPRTVLGAAEEILDTLGRFGMHSAEPPVWQSQREAAYQAAFEQLVEAGFVFPCSCTRREIADSLAIGHTRQACHAGLPGNVSRWTAWQTATRMAGRMRVPDDDAAILTFKDRWQGMQTQDLASEVGDFVLKRADGEWAYQLAVVVDDADAHITHIVRGADLLDSTARQIYLQRCLGPGHSNARLSAYARSGERARRKTQQANGRHGA